MTSKECVDKILELIKPLSAEEKAEVFDTLEDMYCFSCGLRQPSPEICMCLDND
jgi:hypothetical protein